MTASMDGQSGLLNIIVSFVSLFSGIFNFTSVGYAIDSLRDVYKDMPEWASSGANSAALWGSVVGMCVFGYLGDFLGRSRGMSITLFFVVLGSIGSSVLTWGDESTLLACLVMWRFILGLGVGGVFPLSAVSASESSPNNATAGEKSKRVGYVFLATPVAAVATPLLIFLLIEVFPEPSVAWRIILGCGALPAVFVFFASLRGKDSEEFTTARQQNRSMCARMAAPKIEANMRRALIGTAGSWFLLDVAWYGIAVCMPQMTHMVFQTENKRSIALYNAAILSIAIPGNFFMVWLAADHRLGRRGLQIVGFCMMTLSFSGFAVAVQCQAPRAIIISLFLLVVLTTNNGCGLTTYVLPQEVFPAAIRSSMNGISAACGKVGGALGVMLFSPIVAHYGLPTTMYTAAACQALGALFTYIFIPVRSSGDCRNGDSSNLSLADCE